MSVEEQLNSRNQFVTNSLYLKESLRLEQNLKSPPKCLCRQKTPNKATMQTSSAHAQGRIDVNACKGLACPADDLKCPLPHRSFAPPAIPLKTEPRATGRICTC
jgi:hypothetical protein